MDTQKIAQTLADAFVNTRMTFDELSSKTNIPKSALHRYMTGETEKIPLDRFEAICTALGLDAASVLGWKPVTWDHTIHEWPMQEAPAWIEAKDTPTTVNDSDKTKIYQALGALAKADKDAAVTLFTALIDQGVL